MNIFRPFLIIAYSLIIIVSCNGPDQQSDTSRLIEEYFDSLDTTDKFSGVVLFKEGDEVKFGRAYGIANRDLKTPFTLETRMEIASVSKQFTSMAIMMLYNEGLLDIDNPANEYLPSTIPFKDITVRHLLTHTSGLPPYEDHFYYKWPEDKYCYNRDILEYYHGLDSGLIFDPGTEFEYSNGGYVLLAEVVNHVSGSSLDSFLNTKIFKPYGMISTGFVDRSEMVVDSTFAPGYMLDTISERYILPDSIPGKKYYSYLSKRLGPGRITTTVLDLSVWDSLLSTNTLLPYNMLNEMITPFKLNSDSLTTNYAFGWRVEHDMETGWHCHHTGSWAGNKAYISRFFQSIPGQNMDSGDTQNNKSDKIPENSVIIFTNTNLSYSSTIYNYVDSVILSHRLKSLQ